MWVEPLRGSYVPWQCPPASPEGIEVEVLRTSAPGFGPGIEAAPNPGGIEFDYPLVSPEDQRTPLDHNHGGVE
jgi:hypothetical protein